MKFYEINRGDMLKVITLDDDEGINTRKLGCVGEVVRIHYGGPGSPGVGESREDPMVMLKFKDGVVEGFFLTELGQPHEKAASSYRAVRKQWVESRRKANDKHS